VGAASAQAATLSAGAAARGEYERGLAEIRRGFELNGDGLRAIQARARLVDSLVERFWSAETAVQPVLAKGIVVAAIGGYGCAQLFPHSDIDLLICVEKKAEPVVQEAIRRISQSLWDCGLQVALTTRSLAECERFDPANAELGLALLDLRSVAGDGELFARLRDKAVAKMLVRDAKAIGAELAALTKTRHGRYGNTLFHLEPNVKDCPGGLRDANACQWLWRLGRSRVSSVGPAEQEPFRAEAFAEALSFLAAVRFFLHERHGRDDNMLDWQAQDAAAERRVGLRGRRASVDAAYWMRAYYRHARVVEGCLERAAESAGLTVNVDPAPRRLKLAKDAPFLLQEGLLELRPLTVESDPAQEPEMVLALFAAMAESGARLGAASEQRIEAAIPVLSANLEEGPALWQQLAAVLVGPRAGRALRTMHALGLLELILPEFHGIDALVIRDAYHRYTVDEHTFVLIDTLHSLEAEATADAPEWRLKLGSMIRELQNPALLYLAALLHDTGKGRQGDHAKLSAQMAAGVLERLEMDPYDSDLVMRLIAIHLEMSAALRRDIFDTETVRVFAGKVQTHETLRMLTLFTYADIAAVHPDALTPWKAENLWRLAMSTANQLDRNVDEERVRTRVAGGALGGGWRKDEKIVRLLTLARPQQVRVERFLEGFPERYVNTRSPETMLEHFHMAEQLDAEPFQIAFHHGAAMSEIALVTHDRPQLFASIAGALAAWGMNVVTADAFANASGIVVDSFRFTDTFQTLALNESERERFVASVRELVAGRMSIEKMLSGRRRGKRKPPRVAVETRIEFDDTASSHSTLLQVVAQDLPGLLRAISTTLSQMELNVEVALIDTEGETAIDVFYLTKEGRRLREDEELELRERLLAAIAANAA
jgi:[protein-PII] uridylyltransferase